jgi:hypothetical protein
MTVQFFRFASLGVLMTLADYFAQPWAAVTHPAIYWTSMTSYRAAIAWVLWQYASSLRAANRLSV